MGRIELPTSPLPRECSTTEPHGHKPAQANLRILERETGIEPASLAWKARVLPLNYSRKPWFAHTATRCKTTTQICGGEDWIRTSVGVSQQIYSLPPLATRAPLQRDLNCSSFFALKNIFKYFFDFSFWRGWRGSNPRPLASEANTLSTELQPLTMPAARDLPKNLQMRF